MVAAGLIPTSPFGIAAALRRFVALTLYAGSPSCRAMGGLRREKRLVGLTLAWAVLLRPSILSFTSGAHSARLPPALAEASVLCTARGPAAASRIRAKPPHQSDWQCYTTACRLAFFRDNGGLFPGPALYSLHRLRDGADPARGNAGTAGLHGRVLKRDPAPSLAGPEANKPAERPSAQFHPVRPAGDGNLLQTRAQFRNVDPIRFSRPCIDARSRAALRRNYARGALPPPLMPIRTTAPGRLPTRTRRQASCSTTCTRRRAR